MGWGGGMTSYGEEMRKKPHKKGVEIDGPVGSLLYGPGKSS